MEDGRRKRDLHWVPVFLDQFFIVDNLRDTAIACPARRRIIVEANVHMVIILNLLDLRSSVIGDEDKSGLAVGCRYRQ